MMEISKQDIARDFEQLTRHFEQLKAAYCTALASDRVAYWYLKDKVTAFERQVKATHGFVEDASRQRG